jgi:hypothetical protein
MKLQALHEGIRDRTQKKRKSLRLKADMGNYQSIVDAVAEALVPIIEGDENALFYDMGYDQEDYDGVEDYFARVDMGEYAKFFGQNLAQPLQEAWDKKWNSN